MHALRHFPLGRLRGKIKKKLFGDCKNRTILGDRNNFLFLYYYITEFDHVIRPFRIGRSVT